MRNEWASSMGPSAVVYLPFLFIIYVNFNGGKYDIRLRLRTARVQPYADFVAAYLELIGFQGELNQATFLRLWHRLKGMSIETKINHIPRNQVLQLHPEPK